jgi:endoglycosylceramidase
MDFALIVLCFLFVCKSWALTGDSLPVSMTGAVVPIINKDTNMLLDEDGRERYFHGTNVVVKGPPYYPKLDSFHSEISFCDEDMELLRSMGHNIIRLSLPW